jgi:hypothetical protein
MASYAPSPGLVGSAAALPDRESRSSGVSWGAVMGGGLVVSALHLILLALGAGFGLSVVSPWSNAGISARAVNVTVVVWLVVIEVIAAGFGGYLTGRLRTRWALIHTDEVFFRDTANGFLAWAVALVLSVVFLASAAGSMTGEAIEARPSTQQPGVAAGPLAESNLYFVDALFRSDHSSRETGDSAVRAEAARIFANGLIENHLSRADQTYLSQLVAASTGLSQPEAAKRVDEVVQRARQALDDTRKATAHLLLWLFLSLLTGALIASYAATIGGRQRDHVKTTV